MASTDKRVLVVDDDSDTVAVTKALLRHAGCMVRTAASGTEAIAAFLDFDPEIIFLDLALPRMNGFEVTRRLRELPGSKATFIVIVSGYSRPTDKAEALSAGANYFVAKPADPVALVELSETFCRPSSGGH